MKIIIPTSPADIHRAARHAQVLRKFGGLETHEVIYFCAPSVKEQTHEAAKINGARVVVMDGEPQGGWPVACNQMFSAIVVWLGRTGNTSPFLFMELDMLPVRPHWATLLEKEYAIKGKPFLGTIVPYGTASSPAPDAPINYAAGETMMMGCGIYPPHMHADERIRWAIQNLGKQPGQQPRVGQHFLAFDVYLRHPMKAFGMAHTPLIGDQWNTGSYRYVFGEMDVLQCDPLPFDRPHRKRGGVVPKEAVVIHGCKDDSLVNLLLGNLVGKNVWGEEPTVTVLKKGDPEAWVEKERLDALYKKVVRDGGGVSAPVVLDESPPASPQLGQALENLSKTPEGRMMVPMLRKPEVLPDIPSEKPQPKLVVSKANLKSTDAELKEEIYEALRGDKLTTAMLAKKLGMRNNIVGMKAKKFGLEKDKHGFFKKPKKDEKGDWV